MQAAEELVTVQGPDPSEQRLGTEPVVVWADGFGEAVG